MHCLGRVLTAIAVTLFLGVVGSSAIAGEPTNVDSGGVAISGYDSVAYFTEGRATPGEQEFEYVWRDAKWWFANAEHRDLFISDPDRFAPRFGGFCTGGMSMGVQMKADPEAWSIVDGRLYLTSTMDARDRLLRENTSAKIEDAEVNWEKLRQGER